MRSLLLEASLPRGDDGEDKGMRPTELLILGGLNNIFN